MTEMQGGESKEEIRFTTSLVLDNGDTILVDYPESSSDKFLDIIHDHLRSSMPLVVGNYGVVSATYHGHELTVINFNRVVGYE